MLRLLLIDEQYDDVYSPSQVIEVQRAQKALACRSECLHSLLCARRSSKQFMSECGPRVVRFVLSTPSLFQLIRFWVLQADNGILAPRAVAASCKLSHCSFHYARVLFYRAFDLQYWPSAKAFEPKPLRAQSQLSKELETHAKLLEALYTLVQLH